MIIRPATIEDAEAIGLMHVQSWQATYKDIFPAEYLANLDIDERIESWQEILKGPPAVLVAAIKAQIIGFIDFESGFDGLDEDSVAEVYAIYLHPDHWRRGIGTALWQAALAEIQEEHAPAVILWVLEDNVSARRFYESLGLTPDGKTSSRSVLDRSFVEIRYRLDLRSN